MFYVRYVTGPVENQGRALAAQHYAELDLFDAAVGHTTPLCLFPVFTFYIVVFFMFFFFLFSYFVY